jgi:ABC-type phosphate transport system substrate-binding protein
MKKILIILIVVFASFEVFAGDVVVVSKNSSVNSIDKVTLVDIYKLDVIKWDNGEKINLCSYSDANVSTGLYAVLGTKHAALKKIWLKKVLTGEAVAPKNIGSVDEMISTIKSDKNAVGVIPEDKVSADLKVIFKL